jgi:flavin reductase (DIM6/NTAB) family NADH-FMN oxidoreductase RutF
MKMTTEFDRLSRENFVEVMAAVCTPVTVATALRHGEPHGTTVSAFCSLSLEPPMVSLALDQQSELLAIVTATGRVGINVLAHGQEELAMRFAKKGKDKFEAIAWAKEEELPRLPAALGWLACDVADLVVGGDHTIVIGRVRSAGHQVAAPLVYQRRLFGTHSEFLVGPDA